MAEEKQVRRLLDFERDGAVVLEPRHDHAVVASAIPAP